MRIVTVPVLLDNYADLVISDSGVAAVVDPSEAKPVLDVVAREGADLRAIWNTHHHWDHVGGNRDMLLAKTAQSSIPKDLPFGSFSSPPTPAATSPTICHASARSSPGTRYLREDAGA